MDGITHPRCFHSPGNNVGISIVILYKLFERIRLTSIRLDTSHNAFPANGVVVRDIIVHATVGFRTIDSPAMHEGSFKHIDDVVIAGVEDEMTPCDIMNLSCHINVIIPTQSLGA